MSSKMFKFGVNFVFLCNMYKGMGGIGWFLGVKEGVFCGM
jgi:hypothetical protein